MSRWTCGAVASPRPCSPARGDARRERSPRASAWRCGCRGSTAPPTPVTNRERRAPSAAAGLVARRGQRDLLLAAGRRLPGPARSGVRDGGRRRGAGARGHRHGGAERDRPARTGHCGPWPVYRRGLGARSGGGDHGGSGVVDAVACLGVSPLGGRADLPGCGRATATCGPTSGACSAISSRRRPITCRSHTWHRVDQYGTGLAHR